MSASNNLAYMMVNVFLWRLDLFVIVCLASLVSKHRFGLNTTQFTATVKTKTGLLFYILRVIGGPDRRMVQCVQLEKRHKEMALALSRCIFDPMLEKPKYI